MNTIETVAPVSATKAPTKKEIARREKEEAVAKLRAWFPKGSTVHCNVEHVSKSGMMRIISIRGYDRDESGKVILHEKTGEPYEVHPNYAAATALGWPLARAGRDGIKVSGCGMDMCFHLVYTLSHVIHGDGYALNHR